LVDIHNYNYIWSSVTDTAISKYFDFQQQYMGAFGNSTLSDLSGFFLKLVSYRQKKYTQIAQKAVSERTLYEGPVSIKLYTRTPMTRGRRCGGKIDGLYTVAESWWTSKMTELFALREALLKTTLSLSHIGREFRARLG
jgi:hypothetical protein